MKTTFIRTLAISTLTFAGFGLSSCEKSDQKISEKKTETTQEKKLDVTTPTQASEQTPTTTVADPGKLKPIMVGLGAEMNVLQSALWLEDFEVIAESAMKVADHPKVSDAEKLRVKTAMGEDMGAFVAMDTMVHDGAEALSKAAQSKDMPKTLDALATLQRNCVSCHATFRTRLIETN